jgi:two-component system CheB/CheR fusion protein
MIPSEGGPPPCRFAVVGIGASAGGIKALKSFFEQVTPNSGMAYVVIMHLSEAHESKLAEILQTDCPIPVTQVNATAKVEPNHVYVIPPTSNLKMADGEIRLAERVKTTGVRLPIDLFFRTLADTYGRDAYAVVLSGTGRDGTLGIQRVKEEGGVALAQDPGDAEYDDMPAAAIATRLVDVILPADRLPAKIEAMRKLEDTLGMRVEALSDRQAPDDSSGDASALREVLAFVRLRTGHDFASYKQPTVLRRIARRLQVHEVTDLSDYLKLLRKDPDEVRNLQRDLLITVTNFFRDKESFRYLEEHIIPKLFEGKTAADTVRVWSCGCGTGEEAYSLGMLLQEYAATLEEPPRLQIFASDINEEPLRIARECTYGPSITTDVSPERLQHFFTKENESYRVKKSLREIVLFAAHNVLRDPPFSHLDLVVCRNLLIYLNRESQARVMAQFAFAMRSPGYLFLGASEAAENSEELFVPIDKKHRVYRNNRSPRHRPPPLPIATPVRWETAHAETRPTRSEGSYANVHHRLLADMAPPSILVNENHDILHMSQGVGRFLQFSGGEFTCELLANLHPALRLDLRTALIAAAQQDRQTEFRNIRLTLDDTEHVIHLTVRPVTLPESPARYFLILFEDGKQPGDLASPTTVLEPTDGSNALASVVLRLEEELRQTRENLRLTAEHGDISTEELKASNEEFQAINEELRSTTEELETSKEELQSVNEELVTVNIELKDKVAENSEVISDLQNLMHSTDIGTIFLDRELKIKRYTRRIEQFFNIIPSDAGRPFDHFTHRFDYAGLAEDAATVLGTLTEIERELRVKSGPEIYFARILPYRAMDDSIGGVVISFVDITQIKRASATLRERILLKMAQEAAKAGVWTLNPVNGGAWWSDECHALYGKTPGEFPMTFEHWVTRMRPGDYLSDRDELLRCFKDRTKFTRELRLASDAGDRWILEVGRAVEGSGGEADQIAGISLDVTERVRWQHEQSALLARREMDEAKLREADRRKNEFLATLAHELRNPLATIRTGLEVLRLCADDEEKAEVSLMMERQVEQIVNLVDDLLDIARISEGKIRLHRQRFDLTEAIKDAVETSAPLIRAGGHRLTVSLPDRPVFLNADATRICQIILNLLGNAAKFTGNGGSLSLAASVEDQQAVIRVRDNGIGIAAEMLPRVFDLFFQADHHDRHQQGLGIGLSLVHQLTEMHGGSIDVHSEGLGKGSEFTLLLPLEPNQSPSLPASIPPRESAPASASRRILVVDDNTEAAEMLGFLLARGNHAVKVAHDAHSAYALAADFHPEIVLLDIGLPGIDGFEVARKLRGDAPSILIIGISGWGQDEDRERSRNAGFDHHLIKPASIDEIHRLIATSVAD